MTNDQLIGDLDPTSRYDLYGPFRFFDLPVEIRNIIYHYAIPLRGCTAVGLRPTPKAYAIHTFMVDELEGLLQDKSDVRFAARGLHDASRKLRAEVTSVYRTSFNLVLLHMYSAPWTLKSLVVWGASPFLRDVTLKVFFAPSMQPIRQIGKGLMEWFGLELPHVEALKSCPQLARLHFDIAMADCNQQCQIGPIFEGNARTLFGSHFDITARTTTCDHCPGEVYLRSPNAFSDCREKRQDTNRVHDAIELASSSAIERWKWTCATGSNVWNISRFKFDIESQTFKRVLGLSDLISQYRRNAFIDQAAAKETLRLIAHDLRNNICDTTGCNSKCQSIPVDLRYARVHCCRFCELAWFCQDHGFVGQHALRGKHWMGGYCLKRPLPSADGMVHMAPIDNIAADRIYDKP